MAESTLLDYWVTVYKRRYALLTIVLSSVATAVYLSQTLAPVYEAKASFYLPSDVQRSPLMSSGSNVAVRAKAVANPLSSEESYKPYIGILKSRRVAERVHEQYPSKTVAKLLRSDMDFELTDELILVVYSRDNDPALAAQVANAYVDALEAILREGANVQLQDDPRVLRERVAAVRAKREAAEKTLQEFEQRERMPELEQELRRVSSTRSDYEKRLSDIRISRTAIEREIAALRRELADEGMLLPEAAFVISTPLIESLRTRAAALASQLEGLRVTLGADHADAVRVSAELGVVRKQLDEEIRSILRSTVKPGGAQVEALRRNVASKLVEKERLAAEEAGVTSVIASLDKKLEALPATQMEWARRSGEVTRLRQLETSLRMSLEETELQAQRSSQVIVRLQTATPPKRPSFPLWWLNASVGVLGGLVVGLLYCFLLGYIERTATLRVSSLAREIAD